MDTSSPTTREMAEQVLSKFRVETHPWNIHSAIARYERTGEFVDEDGNVTRDHEWTEEEVDALYGASNGV